jgi:preprotein translocase subunit SecA
LLGKWSKERERKALDKIQKQYLTLIDEAYRSLQSLNDFELEQVSVQLIEEVKQANPNVNHRIQAFALVKEATRRAHGLEMFDEQLIGGWVLCDGIIAEMKTGEGKTILSLLPAFWYALQLRGVHIITVNEYLARRDYEHMRRVFQFLRMTVGLNLTESNPQSKRFAYQQSVTFGTSSEFGFDYLLDHLVIYKTEKVQRDLAYAILDEVDNILIDEARTPLIIAGKTKSAPDLYYISTRYIDRLQEDRDYEIDNETRQAMFTEEGIRRIEAVFQIDNLYNQDHTTVYHYMLQSLRAKALFQRDIDYIVSENKVILIDAFTGRMMEGRQYSEGLHQAIEAKENVPLSEEIRTNGMITVQKYFSLYGVKVGMSGTVKSVEDEMKRIYQLDVIAIPTHKPMIRKDEANRIFMTKNEKLTSIINEIQQRYSVGHQ